MFTAIFKRVQEMLCNNSNYKIRPVAQSVAMTWVLQIVLFLSLFFTASSSEFISTLAHLSNVFSVIIAYGKSRHFHIDITLEPFKIKGISAHQSLDM